MNTHRIFTSVLLMMLALSFGFTEVATAERFPSEVLKASSRKVKKSYRGKTWFWNASKTQGAYLAKNGDIEIVTSKAVAKGKWFVTTKANLCYKVNWLDGATSREESKCWEHVDSKISLLWRREIGKSQWSPLDSTTIAKGNALRGAIKAKRKALGL